MPIQLLLLFLGGHGSHALSTKLVQYARENGVMLFFCHHMLNSDGHSNVNDLCDDIISDIIVDPAGNPLTRLL